MKTPAQSRKKLVTGCSVFTALVGFSVATVEAESNVWDMRATGQAVVGSYGGSDLRDTLFAAGFFIGGDYLEQGGFTLGYNYTEVEGKADNSGDFDTLEENTFYLGGRVHSYPDNLGGKLTWRLDGYLIKDEADVKGGNGQAGSLWADGDIGVVNPIVSFINNKKTRAFDLGYAYSNYDYDGFDDYQAHQLTPTFGFAPGGPSNWVQLRGYFIHLSEDDVNDGNSDTAALEAKWTHWFGPNALLGLYSAGVTALVGERFLAVDPDAAVVYTLADEQQESIALNGSWKLGDQTSLMLQVGYDQYENRALNDDYESVYIYLNVSHGW
jgi:hypothetical protein